MSAAHIEAGTEVTVTVRPWVMQSCSAAAGWADPRLWQLWQWMWWRCSAADCRVETSAPTSTALLCSARRYFSSLALQHAANITQHGRHHGHVAAGQHNTTLHVSTCEHGGTATCRLLLGGVAPEVLRALVLAGAALPVGRAGGVRHGGGS